MKALLQSEQAECGLMCLGMVARAHGLLLDRDALRRRFGGSLRGVTLSQLVLIAPKLGLAARAVGADIDALGQLELPCILHWDFNHFVVLAEIRRGRLTLLDPAVGMRRMTTEAASRHFTGVALELKTGPDFKPADERRRLRLQDLVGRVFGLRRALLNVLVLALGIEVVAVLFPFVTQWVVDGALVSADRDLLLLTVIGGALLIVLDTTLRMFRGWINLRLGQQVSLKWTSNLFSHLMSLPLPYFEKRHLGDIAARFGSLGAIRNVLMNGAIAAFLDGLMAVVTLCLMFVYSAKLSWVAVMAVGLYGALRWISYRPFRNASEERIVLSAKEQSHFLETIRAVQPLKLTNAIPQRLAHWQNLLVDVQNRDTATQKMGLAFSTANTFIFGVEGMLLLYFGGLAVLEGVLTLGMLLAFLAYKSQFGGRASRLIDLGVEVKMLSLHAERLADIALEAPEPAPPGEVDVIRLSPTLQFRNVSFRYGDGDPWILQDVSFYVEAGQAVAIVGRSGCGKTTLLKLALGLLQPSEGEVRIGGLPLKQLGLDGVRRMCGTVMQDDHLLAGTLFENISSFEASPSKEAVEDAAKLAHIAPDIFRMPMGFQTIVSDMGGSLSGGQKQRVLLARALYRKPRMLALDEATSHLDLHVERHLVDAVGTLPLTRLIIAHRHETIAGVDRIIALSGGRIERDVAAADLAVNSDRSAPDAARRQA